MEYGYRIVVDTNGHIDTVTNSRPMTEEEAYDIVLDNLENIKHCNTRARIVSAVVIHEVIVREVKV